MQPPSLRGLDGSALRREAAHLRYSASKERGALAKKTVGKWCLTVRPTVVGHDPLLAESDPSPLRERLLPATQRTSASAGRASATGREWGAVSWVEPPERCYEGL